MLGVLRAINTECMFVSVSVCLCVSEWFIRLNKAHFVLYTTKRRINTDIINSCALLYSSSARAHTHAHAMRFALRRCCPYHNDSNRDGQNNNNNNKKNWMKWEKRWVEWIRCVFLNVCSVHSFDPFMCLVPVYPLLGACVCVYELYCVYVCMCLCTFLARPDRSRRIHYVLIENSRGHIELTSNLYAHNIIIKIILHAISRHSYILDSTSPTIFTLLCVYEMDLGIVSLLLLLLSSSVAWCIPRRIRRRHKYTHTTSYTSDARTYGKWE